MQRHEQRQVAGLALSQQMRLSLDVLHMGAGRLRRRLRYAASINPALALTEHEPAAHMTARQALLDQVGLLRLTAAEARVARALVHCLDDHGWLVDPVAEVAQWLDCAPEAIDALLPRLQTLEPTGVFARSLAEHLRLCLQARGRYDPMIAALLGRLDLAASGDLAAIALHCGCDAEDAAGMLDDLRGLAPCPLADGPVAAPPELELTAEGALVWLGSPGVTLHDQADAQARVLAAAVGARSQTLMRAAQAMVAVQMRWLLGAGPQRPLTLAALAGELGLAKSTLSRAMAGVAIRSPRGTLPLRALLLAPVSPRLPETDRETVLRLLSSLIANWPATEPISDARLAEALARRGMGVARRTVAKYRAALARQAGTGPTGAAIGRP
ncbi:MAG: RNA polymerase subunit sigma-54 [Paracoccus sp. (in: a-proteobacteria)]